jgi:predicted acetyltransferase
MVNKIEVRRYEMKEGLFLVKPNINLQNEYLDMIDEWKKYREEMIPWSLNFDTSSFQLTIEKFDGYSKGIGMQDGYVECSTYWLIKENNKVLGAIDIRHRLNDNLLFRGGHIGYGIRPRERRKGYATEMLREALKVCKGLKIPRVLITCSKDNLGSARTIINNGGILASEDVDNGEIFQRYWINIEI